MITGTAVLVITVLSTLCATAAPAAAADPAFTRIDVAVGDSPRAVAVGDFNGDGRLDLATANLASETVSIRLGDGTGHFTSAPDVVLDSDPFVKTDPTSIAVGDFNGDGRADLAVALLGSDRIALRLGDGAGNFSAVPDRTVFGDNPRMVAAADFNGDGRSDVAVANAGKIDANGIPQEDSLGLFHGAADGSLTFAFNSTAGISGPYWVAVADVNLDGRTDMVVANHHNNTASPRLNNAGGWGWDTARVGTDPVAVDVGDLDGDGKPDLVAANNGGGNLSIRMNDGTDFYTTRPDVPVGSNPVAVAVADFNADGKRDLAVTRTGLNAVIVRLNGGLGYFSVAPDVPVGGNPVALKVADFDGDFQPDLAVVNAASDSVSILLNQALRNPQAALTVTSTSGPYGTPLALTASGGSGTGGLTFSATNGTATGCTVSASAPYRLSSTSAGTCMVTATKAGDANFEPISSAPTTVTFTQLAASLRINDVRVTEGNSGTTAATFTITRSGNTSGTSSVTWATANNSAGAGTDYVGVAPASVSFGPAETTKAVTVTINGDLLGEADETFFVNLSAPVGTTLADASGLGTIVNDDTSLAVNDVTVTEGNSGTSLATFTITRAGALAGTSTVNWATANNSAAAGSDFVGVAPTAVTFNAAEATKAVSVTVNGDVVGEPDEMFFVKLSSPVGATIWDDTGVGRIFTDDTSLAISNASVVEGNSGTKLATFTVTRVGRTSGTSSVSWATANGTATAGSDYVGVGATALSFAAGETAKAVSVTVNGDTAVEANETFTVNLTSPVGATIADGSGLATITNDDTLPTLVINDVALAEGNSGTKLASFTVTRAGNTSATSSVSWATAANSAAAGTDFVAVPATGLSFAAGETTKTVSVTVNGDTAVEPNEYFFVRLTSPVGATIADASGTGTITNDDASLAIGNASVTEGNVGTTLATFTVTRAGMTSGTSSVTWSTANGSAVAGTDYVAVAATPLSFAAGETAKTVSVTVNGDTTVEGHETFTVNLTSPVGAILADGSGSGAILNDDAAFIINNVVVPEGNAGTSLATFTVTRTGISSGTSSVNWATSNGSASAGTDYVAAAGTLSFAPGDTTKTLAVTVNGDAVVEGNESFAVTLSAPVGATLADASGVGTITNDDTGFSINDLTLPEGNSGTKLATFTVSRSGNTSGTASVAWATANGTAAAGTDYVAVAATTVNFAAGQTLATVAVTVKADTVVEANETFVVNLSSPAGATISKGSGTATIINDDTAVAIRDVSVAEGNAGTKLASFTVVRTGVTSGTSSVTWATANGSASAGSDYVAVGATTLSFAANQTTATVAVTINGDTAVEANETFLVNLSSPVGTSIADASGTGTITNDDSPAP